MGGLSSLAGPPPIGISTGYVEGQEAAVSRGRREEGLRNVFYVRMRSKGIFQGKFLNESAGLDDMDAGHGLKTEARATSTRRIATSTCPSRVTVWIGSSSVFADVLAVVGVSTRTGALRPPGLLRVTVGSTSLVAKRTVTMAVTTTTTVGLGRMPGPTVAVTATLSPVGRATISRVFAAVATSGKVEASLGVSYARRRSTRLSI